jgi:hypothetical protein
MKLQANFVIQILKFGAGDCVGMPAASYVNFKCSCSPGVCDERDGAFAWPMTLSAACKRDADTAYQVSEADESICCFGIMRDGAL